MLTVRSRRSNTVIGIARDTSDPERRTISPIKAGVSYRPTRARCPECGGRAVSEAAGAWTERAKGKTFVCTVCGLEFHPVPKPFDSENKQGKEDARRTAERVIMSTLIPGKRYDLKNIQASVETYRKTYVPVEEPKEPKAVKPDKSIFGPQKKPLPTEWSWEFPMHSEPQAKQTYYELQDQGYDVDVEVVDRKVKGKVYQNIKVTAKRKPEQNIADIKVAESRGFKVAVLPEARFCVKCLKTYPAGSQVFYKEGKYGVYYCTIDGELLRRAFETRPGMYKKSQPKLVEPSVEAPPINLAGQPVVISKTVSPLPYDGKCKRCKREFAKGEQALKFGEYYSCPSCGGFIEQKV